MTASDANALSRRHMLTGTAAAAVASAAAVGFSGLFGDYSAAKAQDDKMDDVPTILNLAATAEAFAITHYYNVLKTGSIKFNGQQVLQLKAALDSELDHLQFLEANGGKPLTTQFYVPFKVWEDLNIFVTVTEQGEAIFIGAYLAAVRRIAELGNADLAATTAQVVGVEAEHLAVIREMGGKLGNNVSLLKAQYYNVSDAVPSLTPFLQGGAGFEGPAKYPGDNAVRVLVGNSGVMVNKPYTDPTVLKNVPANSPTATPKP